MTYDFYNKATKTTVFGRIVFYQAINLVIEDEEAKLLDKLEPCLAESKGSSLSVDYILSLEPQNHLQLMTLARQNLFRSEV